MIIEKLHAIISPTRAPFTSQAVDSNNSMLKPRVYDFIIMVEKIPAVEKCGDCLLHIQHIC